MVKEKLGWASREARRAQTLRHSGAAQRNPETRAPPRLTDEKVLATIAEATQRELRLGDLTARAKCQTVEVFREYLYKQAISQAEAAGSKFDLMDQNSGAAYVLRQIDKAISRFYKRATNLPEVDPLD